MDSEVGFTFTSDGPVGQWLRGDTTRCSVRCASDHDFDEHDTHYHYVAAADLESNQEAGGLDQKLGYADAANPLAGTGG